MSYICSIYVLCLPVSRYVFGAGRMFFHIKPFMRNKLLWSNVVLGFQKQPLEVFYKKSVVIVFFKTHRKIPVSKSFFNKIAGLRAATLLKKRFRHRCFSLDFAKFLRPPFCHKTSGWLLLELDFTYINSSCGSSFSTFSSAPGSILNQN